MLIIGPSGSGKSSLALALMALGAALVADDRVVLTHTPANVIASAPPSLKGLIEARFVGLLHADSVASAPVAAVVDLGTEETDRLPYARHTPVLGQSVPLLRAGPQPIFAPALVQFMKAGRKDV